MTRVWPILLTQGAEQDLEAIYDYLHRVAGSAPATTLLEQLMQLAHSLAEQPERGHFPPELVSLGIKEYRQLVLAPYRIIYRLADDQVIIYVIADARRDLQALLARRLFSA